MQNSTACGVGTEWILQALPANARQPTEIPTAIPMVLMVLLLASSPAMQAGKVLHPVRSERTRITRAGLASISVPLFTPERSSPHVAATSLPPNLQARGLRHVWKRMLLVWHLRGRKVLYLRHWKPFGGRWIVRQHRGVQHLLKPHCKIGAAQVPESSNTYSIA